MTSNHPASGLRFFEDWYRSKLRESIPDLITKWEKIINVKVNKYGIKKMKMGYM
ncbi:MAG: DUF45 domain-containing protein [Ignavibacteria bacterium]|nr:DUF45 domain-containing protein [Ignavibacteria bacterium]